VDKEGVQIGIIGAIGDCYSSIAVDKCDEVYFKTGSQLTSLVKAEANRLRQQGADFIVYLIHDGYDKSNYGSLASATSSQLSSYYDVSLSDGFVDLVFEGHTHQGYLLKDEHGVYHLQNRGDNKGGVSHAAVSINAVTGTAQVQKAELVNNSQYQNLPDDPLIDQLLKKYESEIAPANKVLGTNSRVRNSTELCQIMANLYYQLGENTWGNEYKIVLGGGFLNTRSPYKLFAGDVTYADLQSVFPFDNQLVLCSISGTNLKSKFINTSNDSYYIAYGSYGNSIKNNIQNNATYYVVVDTYTADYAPNRLTVVKRFDETTFGRDLMADYIAAGGLS
jgi:2',3'-cyclic-nucleotide 2'-phosphodiesterase (5'-nucleotidase family)